MSRPRTSVADLRLQHSPNIARAMRREAQDAQPKFTPGIPEPPPDLSEQERGLWERVVSALSAKGVLAKEDGLVIERYVTLRVRWWREIQALENEGTLIEQTKITPGGATATVRVINPRVRLITRAESALLALEKELHLTPGLREPAPKSTDKEALFREYIQKSQGSGVQ